MLETSFVFSMVTETDLLSHSVSAANQIEK